MAFFHAPPYRPAAMEDDPMNAPDLLGHEPSAHTITPRPETPLAGIHEMDVIQAARSGACVLFTARPNAKGIALLIHSLSGWRWGSFVAVDCGASESLLDRQLFALLAQEPPRDSAAEPLARLTQDGTIFLYEVGRLSYRHQARLADALAAGTPGDPRRRPRKRIMASTSVSLLDRVESGTFDDRLFYRLNTIHFTPPEPGDCAGSEHQ